MAPNTALHAATTCGRKQHNAQDRVPQDPRDSYRSPHPQHVVPPAVVPHAPSLQLAAPSRPHGTEVLPQSALTGPAESAMTPDLLTSESHADHLSSVHVKLQDTSSLLTFNNTKYTGETTVLDQTAVKLRVPVTEIPLRICTLLEWLSSVKCRPFHSVYHQVQLQETQCCLCQLSEHHVVPSTRATHSPMRPRT